MDTPSQTKLSRGHVKGQPIRFLRGHNARLRDDLRYREEDRGFVTPCWIWEGSVDHNGYGRRQKDGIHTRAHRVSFERFIGSIPDGLQLDHLCRVRACVNPAHLEAVTPKENIRRGIASRQLEASAV